MSVVENLEPKLLWKQFDEIRKIPRCSKHEEKIREYIINFAKKQNLKTKVDKAGNVVIIKPASKGMENKPTVILQGHMDMVCEKNSNVDHDFTKDPIKLKIDGDILTADGTTLGADDGIGVATALAILEDTSLKHGPIEGLFTVDEETGLTGAFALESDMITGRIMLNLDSEDFGVITVGCAGGGDSKIELPIKMQPIVGDLISMNVKVSGLRGGHSGVDAHEQRGNAIKILNRLLWKTSRKYDFYLSEIKGGDKHNAIPREAYANIAIKKPDKDKFISALKTEEKDILEEIKPIDPNLKVEIKEIDTLDKALDKNSRDTLLNLLHGIPHGVTKMSYDIPGLVETSTNFASISVDTSNVEFYMSHRSLVESSLEALMDNHFALSKLVKGEISFQNRYPAWQPDTNSKLLELSSSAFKDICGKNPMIKVIHAGLEAAIIKDKFDNMEIVSIGPTIVNPHSPEESVNIKTVALFWKTLIKIIEIINQ